MYRTPDSDPFSWFSTKNIKKKAIDFCEPFLYVVSKRFFGGRTRKEALMCVRRLNARKRKVVVNFLGEHITGVNEIRSHVTEYLCLIRDISAQKLDATISVKLTQIGLDIDRATCEFNLETILQEARMKQVGVEIDMEDPWYVDDALMIIIKLSSQYPGLRLALQANLIRTQKDLDQIIDAKNIRVRLCKGAYEKPREQFHGNPLEVRINYLILASVLFQRSDYPAIATHDEELLDTIKRRFKNHPSSFELQMLNGIRRDIESRLIREGYTLRVYVPYGKEWLHYGIRRWKTILRMMLRR